MQSKQIVIKMAFSRHKGHLWVVLLSPKLILGKSERSYNVKSNDIFVKSISWIASDYER
jgi:hypothetical protein